MIRSGMAATAAMAVLGTVLLSACGGDKTECKDAPYKTAVRFELKSVFEPGKDNPEIEAAKAQAQSKWEAEVKGKFGTEWANWSGTKSRKLNCGGLHPPTQRRGPARLKQHPVRGAEWCLSVRRQALKHHLSAGRLHRGALRATAAPGTQRRGSVLASPLVPRKRTRALRRS